MQIEHDLAVMAEQVQARGRRGVVCAAAPLAAQVGAQILREGGNAYDAAVSMALAETVLLPPKCGLGGDLVALVWRANSPVPEALIAVGGAPEALAQVAISGGWSDTGPNSVGPPAAAVGYLALATRASKPLEALAAPAIEFAINGFPWAAVCNDLSHQARALVASQHSTETVYFPGGEPISTNTIVKLPKLAEALFQFVADPENFLNGPVGLAIIHAVQSRGGGLNRDDFILARAEWVPMMSRSVHGSTMWATPAPTYGATLLDAVEAMVDPQSLIDQYKGFMAALATNRRSLGDAGGTSMVSAADSDGTAVVVIHSNSYPRFGSGIIVPEYSLVLANRAGRGFNTNPSHPNFPIAGRRPATTLHAWALLGHGSEVHRFVGGTPGGANQVPWNLQTVAQLLDGECEPGVVVTSPRWEWLPDDDGVRIESGFAEDRIQPLREATPRALGTKRWGMKSAQQVIRLPRTDSEAFVAAADPRTVGLALGV